MKDVRFLGILANVDKTVMDLPLDHGFTVEEADFTEVLALIASIEHTSPKSVLKYFHIDYPCVHNGKLYTIVNSVRCSLELDSAGVLTDFSPEVLAFRKSMVEGYLEDYLRKVRMYRDGNICAPLKYLYFEVDGSPKPFMCTQTHHPILCVPFVMKDGDGDGVREFAGGMKFPLERSYVDLAHQCYEKAYHTSDGNHAFLSLMLSLESMYNLDRIDIGQRIRRNAAVFLGENFDDSTAIYERMEDLCLKRSRMVHNGELAVVGEDDLTDLRRYVRESIIRAVKVDRPKEELFDHLNSQGFPSGRARVEVGLPPETTGPGQ